MKQFQFEQIFSLLIEYTFNDIELPTRKNEVNLLATSLLLTIAATAGTAPLPEDAGPFSSWGG